MRIRLIHWMFLHHILIPFKNTLWATPLFFLWWKSFTAMYIEHPYCYWYTSIFYLGMLSINIEIVGHPSIYLLLLFFVLNSLLQEPPILNFWLFWHNTEEWQLFSGVFLPFLVRVFPTCHIPLPFAIPCHNPAYSIGLYHNIFFLFFCDGNLTTIIQHIPSLIGPPILACNPIPILFHTTVFSSSPQIPHSFYALNYMLHMFSARIF